MSESSTVHDIPEIVRELSRLIGTTDDARSLLTQLLEVLYSRLGLAAAIAYATDDTCTRLTSLAMKGIPSRVALRLEALPLARYPGLEGLCGEDAGPVTSRQEISLFDSRLGSELEIASRHWAFLPLRSAARLLGVLAVFANGSEPFDESEMQELQTISAVVTAGLAAAMRLEAEAAARNVANRDLETANRILRAVEALGERPDLPGVLNALAETIHVSFGKRGVLVRLYDARRHELVLEAARGDRAPAIGSVQAMDELDPVLRQALLEQRSVVVESTALAPASSGARFEDRRFIAVPVSAGGNLLGVIQMDEPSESRRVVADELRVLESIAVEATAAIENARLYEEQRRSADLRATMNEILLLLSESLDEPARLEAVLEAARGALRSDDAVLAFIEDGRWTTRFALGALAKPGEQLAPAYVEDGLQALRQHAPAIRFRSGWDGSESGTRGGILVVPLEQRGESFGAAFFRHRDLLAEIDSETLDFATKLGASMSLAIENSRLFHAMQDELAKTRLLQDVALAASIGPDMKSVAEQALEALRRDLALKGGDLRLLRGSELQLVSWFNYPSENVQLISSVDVSSSPLLGARAVREGVTLTHEDDEMTPERRRILERQGVLEDRYVYVPIRLRDQVLGVLALTFQGRRPFSERELELFTSVANVIGQVAENARLFEGEREARQQAKQELETTALLLKAADALNTWTQVEDLLVSLLEVVLESMKHTRATVAFWHPEDSTFTVERSLGDDPIPSETVLRLDELSDAAREAALRPHAIIIDYDALPVEEKGRAAEFRLRSPLFVPLLVRDNLVGVLMVDDPGERREFPPREVELTEGIAAQAAVGIDNARLYETERNIADRLQGALLALPDRISGIEFAHAYHSATEAARVGGDFYDLFEIEHDLIGITVGDVAGKGLDAAVLTSLVKNTIRAHGMEKAKAPSGILALANEVVVRSTPTEAFVTVFFAILDCRTGTLVFSNAGHTTGAVVRAAGGAGRLESNGPLLGAFPGVTFDQQQLRLGYDELLFLYTDGLTEARRDGQLYGEERLFDLLGRTHDGSPADVVREVRDDVLEYSGGRLRDDLAILSVRRVRAEEPPGHEELSL